MKVTNINAQLAQQPSGSFLDIAEFNGHNFGVCEISGESPVWEMHPDTDEFFHILEGQAQITLLEMDGPKHYTADAGTVFVVPKGLWHKPAAINGAKFIYYTPGQSLHSDAADPRINNSRTD